MKKIIKSLSFLSIVFVATSLNAKDCLDYEPYVNGAISSGYVFKHDDAHFRDTYGYGMGNILTLDCCYYPWETWGVGGKISYWLASGKTTFFKRHSLLHELPITFYGRKVFDFQCNLSIYASLGGGIALIKEKSYLGSSFVYKGIGDVEFGLSYPIKHCLSWFSAFRYIFPRQSVNSVMIDPGGFEGRSGFSIEF